MHNIKTITTDQLKVMLGYKTTRFLVLNLAIVMLLTACQTGRGYSTNRQWEYKADQQAQANLPPSTLGEAQTQPALPQSAGIEQESIMPVTAPAPATLPKVKVAILLPLSGKHEKLGQAMLNAAQIALFDIGHQNFQLVPKDTRGTPDGARNATREAVNEGAQLLLGPLFAESVRTARPIAATAQINMLAFSTDWTLAGGNTYIMGFLPFDQIERLTDYAAKQGVNNIGMIAANDNYGRVVSSVFKNSTSRKGITLVKQQTFDPRSRNLSPDIRQFTDYDARKASTEFPTPFNAVFMPVGGQQAVTIANLITHYDLPPTMVRRLGTGLMDDTALATEPSLDGTWFAAPSPNLRRDFTQKYMGTYGKPAPRLATLAYDATALAAVLAQRGIQQTGQPSFDHAAITNPNGFMGINGIFRFRSDGTAERGLAVLEFKHGQITVIDEAPKTFQQSQY